MRGEGGVHWWWCGGVVVMWCAGSGGSVGFGGGE